MSQTIMLFGSSEKTSRHIQEICRSMGIRMQRISPVDYGQTLGALAGIHGFPKMKRQHAGASSLGEMLVFSGMDSDQIDAFLEAYRDGGQPTIALKAVLTPYNIRWTPEQLYTELLKEHEHYHAGDIRRSD